MTLAGEIPLLLRANVIIFGPLAKIQNNIFIVMPITLITPVMSLLPGNVAYLRVQEITEIFGGSFAYYIMFLNCLFPYFMLGNFSIHVDELNIVVRKNGDFMNIFHFMI